MGSAAKGIQLRHVHPLRPAAWLILAIDIVKERPFVYSSSCPAY